LYKISYAYRKAKSIPHGNGVAGNSNNNIVLSGQRLKEKKCGQEDQEKFVEKLGHVMIVFCEKIKTKSNNQAGVFGNEYMFWGN
jgi:hypothetical protein